MLVSGDAALAASWRDQARQGLGQGAFLLVLAATATAAAPGISAAGSTPESRRLTAAADGELVALGPTAPRPHALPPLPAGVSPALISWVVLEQLRLARRMVNAGLDVAPAVDHEQVPGCQPAACLSTGRALPLQQVRDLLRWGRDCGRIGCVAKRAPCWWWGNVWPGAPAPPLPSCGDWGWTRMGW